MSRAVVVACIKDLAFIAIKCLPDDIKAVACLHLFDSPWVAIRLTGDGLPSWCELDVGDQYPSGLIAIHGDGISRITPIGTHYGLVEAAHRQYVSSN